MINRAVIDCFNRARSLEERFVFWRFPNEGSISFVSNLQPFDDFSEDCSAFYFKPFNGDAKSVFQFQNELVREFKLEAVATNPSNIDFVSESRDIFEKQVKQGITRISEGHLTKVVLSRKVSAQVNLNVIDSYLQMCFVYPTAFCYLFYSNETGFWMGATPETFCEISDGVATSMSLAGTRFVANYQPFFDKEFREQELVTQFISSRLADFVYRVRLSERTEIQAGNLIHLQTIVSGRLLDHASLKQLIAALHPTPAVCGLPQREAFEVISELEKYDRSYYTGVVGIVNSSQHAKLVTRLFVNLRCMNYVGNKASLFAGCGIVAASDPEAEFEETEQKFKTIKGILVAEEY